MDRIWSCDGWPTVLCVTWGGDKSGGSRADPQPSRVMYTAFVVGLCREVPLCLRLLIGWANSSGE